MADLLGVASAEDDEHTDDDEFPVPPPQAAEAPSLVCPECGAGPFSNAFAMAGHRYGKHGVRGKAKSPGGRSQKRVRSAPPGRATPSPAARPAPSIAAIRRDTEDAIRKAGALVFPRLRVTGGYAMTTAEVPAEALARIAERNPKVRAWLEGTSGAMDFVALGSWLAGLAYAAAVDTGRMPARGTVSAALGVESVVDDLAARGEVQILGGEPADAPASNGHGGIPVPDALAGGPGPRPQDVAAGAAR